MQFPQIYLDAIERYVTQKSTKHLSQSFKKLSTGYRSLQCSQLGSSREDVEAYLMGRLPLTWSVLCYLLDQISTYLPQEFSVADYGSGPGTALLALHHLFSAERFMYTGIEEKIPMIEAAKALALDLKLQGEFIHTDVVKAPHHPYTLAIASYVLNELKDPSSFYTHLLNSHEYVLVIEPGTPDGYKRLLALRDFAIEHHWHILAPCPHARKCPLVAPDWCHFYLRVERPKSLKQIKGGSMGYEDEKYAYLFLSKTPHSSPQGIIVKKTEVFPFKIVRDVCASSGYIETQEILKKDKEAYKKAKKLDWGDFV